MGNKQNLDMVGVTNSPSRAGMSILSARMVVEQIATGKEIVIIDKGSSVDGALSNIRNLEYDQVKLALLRGRKRNDGPVAKPKTEPPFYRQFDKRKF